MGGVEGDVNPISASLGPNPILPHNGPRSRRRIIHSLINNVPSLDLPLEVRHDLRDVIEHDLTESGGVEGAQPGGVVDVFPEEDVAAEGLVVGSGDVHDFFTGCEGISGDRALGRVELAVVFGDEHVDLAAHGLEGEEMIVNKRAD